MMVSATAVTSRHQLGVMTWPNRPRFMLITCSDASGTICDWLIAWRQYSMPLGEAGARGEEDDEQGGEFRQVRSYSCTNAWF